MTMFEPPGRPRKNESHWTNERKDLASSLWLQGVSASCIAKELGQLTRNAVLGMLNRLRVKRSVPDGLQLAGRRTMRASAKPKDISPEERERRKQYNKLWRLNNKEYRQQYRRKQRLAAKPMPPPAVEPLPEQAVTFAQLNAFHCRWMIGEPRGVESMFCGAIKADGQPYCGFHCRKAFNYDYRNRVPTCKPIEG